MNDARSADRAHLSAWIEGLDTAGLEALAALREAYLESPGTAPGIVAEFACYLRQLHAAAEGLPDFVANVERGFAARGREIWSAPFLLAYLSGMDEQEGAGARIDHGDPLSSRALKLVGAFVDLNERVRGLLVGATQALAAGAWRDAEAAWRAACAERQSELAADRLRRFIAGEENC